MSKPEPFINFIGSSNAFADKSVDGEQSINLFPEINAAPGTDAKAKIILRRRGGFALQQTVAGGNGRGIFQVNGRCFAVVGTNFVELLTPTTSTVRGTIPSGTSPIEWGSNSVQVIFLADGKGYTFNLSTGVFAQITGQDGFPTYAVSLAIVDLYAIVLERSTNKFSISSPADATTWSGLDFSTDEEPDNAVSLIECHGYLYIFNEKEGVLYQDSGGSSNVFTRLPGSQMEKGCAALDSPCVADNTVFWLGQDANGGGMMYRANGLVPQRISNHAIETEIQGYSTIADCYTNVQQDGGHEFIHWHFPTAGTVKVYDTSTQMWHDRGYWDTSKGAFTEDLMRYSCAWSGQTFVCDFSSGNIYTYSMANPDDDGNPLRWVRTSPHISDALNWIFYAAFLLDMSVGQGIPSGVDPQIVIEWSDDGGENFSSLRFVSCGKTGEFAKRVIVNRCGRSRNRVWRVSGSDPLPFLTLIAAWLITEEGIN
jgi:hypothetical protein